MPVALAIGLGEVKLATWSKHPYRKPCTDASCGNATPLGLVRQDLRSAVLARVVVENLLPARERSASAVHKGAGRTCFPEIP